MRTSINKSKLLPAIDELIHGYETQSLNHSFRNCPLCNTFSETCDECINFCFSTPNSDYSPCRQRCSEYSKLNYYRDASQSYSGKTNENDQNLAMFWREVKEVVVAHKLNKAGGVYLHQLKKPVLAIASKYK